MLEDTFPEDRVLLDAPDDIVHAIMNGAEEDHNRSGRDSENEDLKNEDENAKEKVKIKRKIGPRQTLNAQRLMGPRGIGVMESFFSDIKLKGKSHEKKDLELVMGRLEHWAHRLYPRMQFDEVLKKIEKLGTKREIQNYVKRIRLGMEDDALPENGLESMPRSPEDTFDQLMTSTVAPVQPASTVISEEQRERMLRNRLIAEEKRNARIKQAQELKAKFLANQKLHQRENSQSAETDLKAKNQENEIQRNNLQDEQMEIDDNLVQNRASEFYANNINEENVGDFQTEKCCNQSNAEEEDKDSSNLKQGRTIGQDIPIEGIENHTDF